MVANGFINNVQEGHRSRGAKLRFAVLLNILLSVIHLQASYILRRRRRHLDRTTLRECFPY